MIDIDTYRINSLKNMQGHEEFTDHKLTILNFEGKHSIKNWKAMLQRKIEALEKANMINKKTAKDAIQKILQPFNIYLLEGNATIYTYLWETMEYKSILAWGNRSLFLSEEDLYWFNFLPFLQKIKSSSNVYYKFIYPINNSSYANHMNSNILLSHNLHFGHFMVDDLPTIRLFIESNPLKRSVTGLMQRMHKPIIDAASYLALASGKRINPSLLPSTEDLSPKQLIKTVYNNLFQAKTINTYHQCFLARYIFRSPTMKRSLIDNTYKQAKRIFLVRMGDYESRIKNFTEVSTLLQSYGFTLIDPASFSLNELHQNLMNAEIVISESGSTGINASVLSSNKTKVLLLLSKSMLIETSDAMNQSGIPYLLAFIDHVDFITGEPVHKHTIQSSEVVNYCVKDIEAWLIKAFNSQESHSESCLYI